MNYWLVKQEPSAYSWDDFVKDGKTAWTGVRNFQARNNLRSMRLGDLPHPVSLEKIKADKRLAGFVLLRNSRLSVMPVSAQEYRAIADLSRG